MARRPSSDPAGSSVRPANIYQASSFHNPENKNTDAYTSVDFFNEVGMSE